MNSNHTLVIGAGIGGIVTAARLARQGYKVTVVEKGERAGGIGQAVAGIFGYGKCIQSLILQAMYC